MPTARTRCLGMMPRARGVGGMVSFQAKLEADLARRGVSVTYDLEHGKADALLVVGGTRQLGALRRIKQSGMPIVQRLDGINWIHRKRWTGARHFMRAEGANWLLSRIRRQWAGGIVYQSRFVLDWWETKYGTTRTPMRVVHNGVDLEIYTPDGHHQRPMDRIRVLLVEGSLGGGYELGLEHAIAFCEALGARTANPLELMIVGRVGQKTRRLASERTELPLIWADLVPAERIPEIARSAHLLYAGDIHPACPNAVIEALACGLPVAAFDTGAIKELVPDDAGAVVAYGADPWRLEVPDFDSLAAAAVAIVADQEAYRRRAREYAVRHLGLRTMVDGYLEALNWMDLRS